MFEDIAPLQPLHFFSLSFPCRYSSGKEIGNKKYLLPSTSSYLKEEAFSQCYLAWNEEKIFFRIEVDYPMQTEEEEFLELFIDTKDQKHRRFSSLFSHHFIFFLSPVEGNYGREVTRFSKESHPLCNPKDLQVKIGKKSGSFSMDIAIPRYALHGYDPNQTKKIGFTYKINHKERAKEHFSASSQEVNIAQNSYLWATAHMLLK